MTPSRWRFLEGSPPAPRPGSHHQHHQTRSCRCGLWRDTTFSRGRCFPGKTDRSPHSQLPSSLITEVASSSAEQPVSRVLAGEVVIGMMKENRLPPCFETLWRGFAAVVTGVRTHDPTLSFACVDHHALVVGAMERIRDRGIRRPALVIEGGIDRGPAGPRACRRLAENPSSLSRSGKQTQPCEARVC